MMRICRMSSNDFFSAPEIDCGMLIPFQGASCSRLGIAVNGGWYLRNSCGIEPVLLLRNRSVWSAHLALLTLEYGARGTAIVWARRLPVQADAWRRLRVWFNCG